MIGIAVLAFFLIIVNIIFWLVFLRKFKKLFSTDDILASTRSEMNEMIADVNRITSRDIDLIESKLKLLKAVAAEADRHAAIIKSEVETAKNELNRNFNSLNLQQTVSRASLIAGRQNFNSLSQPNTAGALKAYENISDGLKSTEVYSITKEGKRFLGTQQADLFDQGEETFINSPSGTKFTVNEEGTSVAAIPKIGPNVTFSDNPIKPKISLNEQIKNLSPCCTDNETLANGIIQAIKLKTKKIKRITKLVNSILCSVSFLLSSIDIISSLSLSSNKSISDLFSIFFLVLYDIFKQFISIISINIRNIKNINNRVIRPKIFNNVFCFICK